MKDQSNPQRKVQGVPDRPYSLMEGIGGDILCYCDLLTQNVNDVQFPGYEINN